MLMLTTSGPFTYSQTAGTARSIQQVLPPLPSAGEAIVVKTAAPPPVFPAQALLRLYFGIKEPLLPTTFFHMTTADAWDGIQSSGVMRPKQENVVRFFRNPDKVPEYMPRQHNGIFLFSRENFQKYWLREIPPINGFNSVADYFIKVVARRIAVQIGQKQTSPNAERFMTAPIQDVLTFLKAHRQEHPGMVVLEVDGKVTDQIKGVRNFGYTFDPKNKGVETDESWDAMFAGFLDSYQPLDAYLEKGLPANYPMEWIVEGEIPIKQNVSLFRRLSLDDLINLFPDDAAEAIDPNRLNEVLFSNTDGWKGCL